MKNKGVQKFFKSFSYALNGIKYFYLNERNGNIQFVCMAIVIAFAIYFKISSVEWIAVLLCIAMVLAMEMLNSAIERICNKIEPENNPEIKIVKDLAAGAVLWLAIFSAIIACIIFIPKIIDLLYMGDGRLIIDDCQ